jgi:DNA-binding beta-propeller fold protein YncE
MKMHRRMVFLYAALAAFVLLGATCNLSNKAPAVPTVAGPTEGVAGVAVTFSATTTDPDGDSVAYQFDWGDGSTLEWSALLAGAATCTTQHTYADSGTYTIKVRAKDKGGKESGWTEGQTLGVLGAGSTCPDTLLGVVVVGEGACAAAATPDGAYLYVARSGGQQAVTPVRLADRAVLASVDVDGDPFDVAASVDGRYMYVSLPFEGRVLSIRVADNVVERAVNIGADPSGIAATRDGQYIAVTAPTRGMLYALRTSDLVVEESVQLGGGPLYVAAGVGDGHIYVSVDDGVRAVAAATWLCDESLTTIALPGRVAVTPDGHSLYVCSPQDSGLAVVSLPGLTRTGAISVHDPSVGGLAATRDGAYLLVSYLHGLACFDTRNSVQVDSLALEARAKLVMHPTADTAYAVGHRQVFVIGR